MELPMTFRDMFSEMKKQKSSHGFSLTAPDGTKVSYAFSVNGNELQFKIHAPGFNGTLSCGSEQNGVSAWKIVAQANSALPENVSPFQLPRPFKVKSSRVFFKTDLSLDSPENWNSKAPALDKLHSNKTVRSTTLCYYDETGKISNPSLLKENPTLDNLIDQLDPASKSEWLQSIATHAKGRDSIDVRAMLILAARCYHQAAEFIADHPDCQMYLVPMADECSKGTHLGNMQPTCGANVTDGCIEWTRLPPTNCGVHFLGDIKAGCGTFLPTILVKMPHDKPSKNDARVLNSNFAAIANQWIAITIPPVGHSRLAPVHDTGVTCVPAMVALNPDITTNSILYKAADAIRYCQSHDRHSRNRTEVNLDSPRLRKAAEASPGRTFVAYHLTDEMIKDLEFLDSLTGLSFSTLNDLFWRLDAQHDFSEGSDHVAVSCIKTRRGPYNFPMALTPEEIFCGVKTELLVASLPLG